MNATLPVGDVTRARANTAALDLLRTTPADATLTDLTGEQIDTLNAWTGWGPMAKVLDPRVTEQPWAGLRDQANQYFATDPTGRLAEAAAAATPNAFYTPDWVMRAAWQIVVDYGTPAGPVLEPGCGSGRFAGCAPDGYTIHGVEADPTSARIARILNPSATIVEGRLERTALPAGFVAAVGNVPYGDVKIRDRTISDYGYELSLHNYFLARAVQAVMPGGLVVALTSRWTLDSEQNWADRSVIARWADVVGAVRLTNGAMRDAGTDVVADLIVLRRHDANQGKHHMGVWPSVRKDLVPGHAVSGVFADPDLVLGRMEAGTGQYGPEVVVRPVWGDPAGRMPAAVAKIRGRLVGLRPPAAPQATPGALTTGADLSDGTYERVDGKMFRVEGGRLVACRAGRELHDLVTLRGMVLDLIDADVNTDVGDDEIAGVRAITLALYQSYVKKYGPLNRCTISEGKEDPDTGVRQRIRRRPSMGGFRSDPHYVTVLSIEDYDDDTGEARPGLILRGRVNRRVEPVTSVSTAGEAVAVSMDQVGRVDVPLVAGLLGVSEQAAVAALVREGAAFVDPTLGLVPAGEYLSGDVRAKLVEARGLAVHDPSMTVNVAALERVQPVDLTSDDIKVKLGAPWVPVDDVRQFVADTFELTALSQIDVEHEPVAAAWQVTPSYGLDRRPVATARWGTGRVNGYQLVELGLNGSQPVVHDEVWDSVKGKKRKVRNEEETLLACEKLRELDEEFSEWVWRDDARRMRLCRLYNDRYNTVVPRVHDGAGLTFPGMAAGFEPYESQRQMVHRILSSEATLCGHTVGAGKTAIIAMAAMTMRRLGMVRKPMVAVPNHLIEQIAREVKALYPTAKVLMASREDATKERRRAFAAKIATGDWDLVVLAHSTFTAIPVSAAAETEWINGQLVDYREALLAQGDAGNKGARTFKAIQQAAAKLEQRLIELRDKPVDEGVRFEQLGVDYLFIDECHMHKNLHTESRSQALSVKGSKRASDLDMKLWLLRRAGRKRVATLLTGTPVSNTLAEMFVLQRYLSPGRLRHLDLHMFDAWAAMFVEFEAKVEVAPDGGTFRVHRRPSRFCNVAELLGEFAEVADVRGRDDIGLAGPNVVEATEVVASTPAMRAYVDTLVERSDRIRGGVDPREDNMLMVCNDGRKAALDLEMVGVYDSGAGKVGRVVDRVAATWRAHQGREYLDARGEPSGRRGALQIVFCDLGTPQPGDSQVYGKIRRGLIAAGVPGDEIRFVHDARTDAAKAALFSECRSGRVSVLMGSTEKLGMGTNVQHRCVAIHHVDAPWRPADVEQRTGRGNRPGNQNGSLEVVRYVREGSFDAYMWQALERKSRFIAQVMGGDRTLREVEDIGESTLSYTEVKALATGNPLVLDHTEAVAEVARLTRLRRNHERMLSRMAAMAESLEQEADALERHGRWLAGLAATSTPGTGVESVPGWDPGDGDDRNTVGKAIKAAITVGIRAERDLSWYWPDGETRVDLGVVNGVPVVLDYRHRVSVLKTAKPVLRVKAEHDGQLDLVCTLNHEWFKPGQAWRITEAVVDATATLEATSDHQLLTATAKRAEAERALAERGEFPQTAALADAVARKDRIEQQMRGEAVAM